MFFNRNKKKSEFIIRVVHADGFVNIGPMILEKARKQAKDIHRWWVKNWHNNASGTRPLTQIWELVEDINEKVRGVDKF